MGLIDFGLQNIERLFLNAEYVRSTEYIHTARYAVTSAGTIEQP